MNGSADVVALSFEGIMDGVRATAVDIDVAPFRLNSARSSPAFRTSSRVASACPSFEG
jgi:hypothetical protein